MSDIIEMSDNKSLEKHTYEIRFDDPKQYSEKVSEPTDFYIKEVGFYSCSQQDAMEFSVLEEPDLPHLNTDIISPIYLNTGYTQLNNSSEISSTNSSQNLIYENGICAKIIPEDERLLKWVTEKGFNPNKVKMVVTRGILKHIGTFLYDYTRTPFKFRVTQYGGTWYFTEMDKLRAVNREQATAALCDKNFKQLIRAPGNRDTDVWSVVTIDLGDIGNVLYDGGLLDLVNPGTQNKVQVKTVPIKGVPDPDDRLSTMWLQAELCNTEEVLCGMRDAKGVVTKLKTYTLSQIVNQCEGHWDGVAIKGFIETVLEWSIRLVGDKQSATVWFVGGRGRHGNKIKLKVHEDGSYSLPSWYTEYVDRLQS